MSMHLERPTSIDISDLRRSIARHRSLLSHDQILRGWNDLVERSPLVSRQVRGHSVSGPVVKRQRSQGDPLLLYKIRSRNQAARDYYDVVGIGEVHGRERASAQGMLIIGQWLAERPTLLDELQINYNVAPSLDPFQSRANTYCERRLTVLGYLFGSWRPWGLDCIEYENDGMYVDKYGETKWTSDPTTPRAIVFKEIIDEIPPDIFVSAHGAVWGISYVLVSDEGDYGRFRAISTRASATDFRPAQHDPDWLRWRMTEGRFPGVFPYPSIQHRYDDWVLRGENGSPPDGGTMADYVDIVTEKSCFCVLPEFALFGLDRIPGGGMTKEAAFDLGTTRVREVLEPLYKRLCALPLDATHPRHRVMQRWLDSMRWINVPDERPDENWRDYLPGINFDSPATGYERFLLDQRRVFLALSRLGETATVLVQLGERELFEDVVRRVCTHAKRLDDECGFQVEPIRKQLVANVDTILTSMIPAPGRNLPFAFEKPAQLAAWIGEESTTDDHLGLSDYADMDAVWEMLAGQVNREMHASRGIASPMYR